MVYSMTGYAKRQGEVSAVRVEVEIKALNSRYLDFQFRAPRLYNEVEVSLRKLLSEKLERGRIELTITRQEITPSARELGFNSDMFKAYYEGARTAYEAYFPERDSDLPHIAREILVRKDVFQVVEEQTSLDTAESDLLFQLVTDALEALLEMRAKEGAHLKAHIQSLCKDLSGFVSTVEKLRDSYLASREELVKNKVEEFKTWLPVDELRVAQEFALLVDRSDITEELIRLKSHLEQYPLIMKKKRCGKKVEFLAQECLREVNTIGSKAQNSDITNQVIEAKAVLEKVREQAANIE